MLFNELKLRLVRHGWVKGAGSTGAIGLFFVGYFFALHYPVFSVQRIPALVIDNWIPILPWSVWVYVSLWVYICLPQALMKEMRPMGHYLLGAAALAGLGLVTFVLWPTATPDWNGDGNTHRMLAALKVADAAGNACPSLHAGFAVFSGCWLATMLKRLEAPELWQWGNGLWGGVIILSTLTTKQHVVLDVVAGVALGLVVFLTNRWWLRRLAVNL
jgi:hypothetical protein